MTTVDDGGNSGHDDDIGGLCHELSDRAAGPGTSLMLPWQSFNGPYPWARMSLNTAGPWSKSSSLLLLLLFITVVFAKALLCRELCRS